MVKLSSKRENFELAYAALDRMVKLLRRQPVDPENDLYWSAVMSVIKGFELCYEICWKFLKHYMLEQYKIEALSPRVVFRLSAEHGRYCHHVHEIFRSDKGSKCTQSLQ